MTLSSNTANKHYRRSPSSRATSKIKDMVHNDRKRSKQFANESFEDNKIMVDTDLNQTPYNDQYNFNQYQQ